MSEPESEPAPDPDPVVIVPYDPAWPARFEVAARGYRAALPTSLLRVDHIGSTAVPGLAAKDRIDVLLTLAGPEVVPTLQAELAAAGLPAATPNRDHRPPGDSSPEVEWQKYYLRGPHFGFAMNTHIRYAGRRNHRYALLFRDYLREHPAAAAAYAAFKVKLAAACGAERDRYCDLKDPVCDLVMVDAERWAAATGWSV